MKPLGPYVAARDLPGRTNSPVRTLRATDRLTGMPVLLHALPDPLPVPDLPEHPHVLRPADCFQVGTEALMVTELPLQARPAQDPELTARGALAALAALHDRGVVHGGLSASQLWSVDGEVRLAGAGLPWGGEARPQDDLYALAVILHEMGGVPDALRPLLEAPGQLDARAALRLLSVPAPAARPAPAVSPVDTRGDGPTPEPGPAALTAPVAPPAPAAPAGTRAGRRRGPQPGPTPDVALTPGASAPAVPASPAPGVSPAALSGDDRPGALPPQPEPLPAHDGTPIVLGEPEAAPGGTTPPVPVTLAPAPPAPAGGKLSPQERRRREHEARREQTERDAQAAAERRLKRLADAPPARTQPARTQPAAVPAPLQIGFDGLDDLPEWQAEPSAPAPHPGLHLREVERLPASLRRAPQPPDTGVDPGADAASPPLSGTLPARRRVGEPIRIGWDEDDSWRVVREAPGRPAGTRRPLRWRVLFWVVLAAAFVGTALLLTRLVPARGAGPVTPASVSQASAPGAASGGAGASATPEAPARSQVQTVRFTLRGAAGLTARLSVEQAPKAANLAPGAALGTAPGQVRFPVAGTYRVRVVVDGYAPGSMTVTVPRAQPVTIDLDN
ncbi:hypothetical protein [Deinococcus actinosclerus]|uniref:hypothetical protein n=1 Tax=Deinococcus actinosclerus TaxID=1768108 RepID=UPI000AEF2502|nr:hypothetical protein [Deinococcus actinosclerus]